MYIDRENLLARDQAVTVSAPTTDTIDFGANRDVGIGEPMELVVLCTEDVAAAGAATVQFTLQTDDNEAFASPTVLAETPAISKAALVAGGDLLRIKLPMGVERYLRLAFTVATGPLTAGRFTVFVAHDRQANRTYASGIAA